MKIETKNIGSYDSKFVVCYSGGHSSAICAINAVLRHGKENVILLNHDLSAKVENSDIKRFKNEVAEYLEMDIVYANHDQWETMTPIDACLELGGWKFNKSPTLCTYELKTKPFYDWIEQNDPEHLHTYLYGFDRDPKEIVRMNKRIAAMGGIGCKTDYPLITWGDLEIKDTKEIGVEKPNSYDNFKHANCHGCLKAGWQHWYIVYVHRRDLWDEAKAAEEKIGYSIHKDDYLEDRQELFQQMFEVGVPTTEHIEPNKFWATAKKWVKSDAYRFDLDALQSYDDMACTSCTG